MTNICSGNNEEVELLSKNDGNVNIRDNYNNTPLIWAAYNGNQEIVNLLLKKGADVNASNSFNNTGLINAAENGNFQIE